MIVATDPITIRVHRVVAKTLGLSEGHIVSDQSLLCNDLGVDSLDAVELMMEIEREFEIEVIDEDDPWELKTVADIADFVRRVAAQQGVALS
jgi:acyl carrier protein